MPSDRPKRSSGEPWTHRQHELLRTLWAELVDQFPDRSEAAVRAKLVALADYNYHYGWPDKEVRE